MSRRGRCQHRGSSKDNTRRENLSVQISIRKNKGLIFVTVVLHLSVMKPGDTSKAKTKVWQNKNKGAKKTAKSKKKKLTKKKATPAPAKTKQANGNVAGNVSV